MAEFNWDSKAKFEEKEFDLLPAGKYTFTVVNIEKGFSKAGNPMATVHVGIDCAEHSNPIIKDYFVVSDKMAFKFGQILCACGLIQKDDEFEFGMIDLCMGKTGTVETFIEDREYNGKQYKSARIKKYIFPEKSAEAVPDIEDLPFEL